MNVNAAQLKQEKLSKLTARLIELKTEIDKVSRLLSVTHPVKLTTAQPAVEVQPVAEAKPTAQHKHVDSISAVIQRIKDKQKQVVDEKDTQVEMFKKLAESEAEAMRQKLPELDEGSDSDEKVSNMQAVVGQAEGSLKKLFKQIVKNVN